MGRRVSHEGDAPDEAQVCDRCGSAPVAQSTDGGGVHSVIRYCAACWAWYQGTRPTVRRV